MKLMSAHIEDLKSLYVSNLKKALDMEQKITKALPDMIENATDPQLATAFRNQLSHILRRSGQNKVNTAFCFDHANSHGFCAIDQGTPYANQELSNGGGVGHEDSD